MATDQPALWELPEDHASDSAMVKAAKATLAQLELHDKLPQERAVLSQLVLALAQAIDGGAKSGRASAVALAAAQLRETILVLDPPPPDGDAAADANRRLDDFLAKLDAAAERMGQDGPVSLSVVRE